MYYLIHNYFFLTNITQLSIYVYYYFDISILVTKNRSVFKAPLESYSRREGCKYSCGKDFKQRTGITNTDCTL